MGNAFGDCFIVGGSVCRLGGGRGACRFVSAQRGTAVEVGVILEGVQGMLVAVAPIVGTARIVSAAGNTTRGRSA